MSSRKSGTRLAYQSGNRATRAQRKQINDVARACVRAYNRDLERAWAEES